MNVGETLQNSPLNETISTDDFNHLIEAIVAAVVRVGQEKEVTDALVVRDELRRLPGSLLTEVLNEVILRLVSIDPILCRWFIVDIFLQDAAPEGRADVAERINLLLDDLHRSRPSS